MIIFKCHQMGHIAQIAGEVAIDVGLSVLFSLMLASTACSS